MESTLRQLERENVLLQHKSTESQRRADSESEKKRVLESEGESLCWHSTLLCRSHVAPV